MWIPAIYLTLRRNQSLLLSLNQINPKINLSPSDLSQFYWGYSQSPKLLSYFWLDKHIRNVNDTAKPRVNNNIIIWDKLSEYLSLVPVYHRVHQRDNKVIYEI